VDIIGILGKFNITLQKAKVVQQGVEIQALCPFHDDHHPSMYINIDKGVWHCLACHAGGHITQYIERLTNLSMSEIQKALDGDIPKHIQQRQPEHGGRYITNMEIDALTLYCDILHRRLMGMGNATHGIKPIDQYRLYLDSRGISRDAIEHFKLGANAFDNLNQLFCENTKNHFKPSTETSEGILRKLNLYTSNGGDYWFKPAIILPYMYDGQTYYANARQLPWHANGQRYVGLKGIARELLYNEDAIEQYDEVFAVEGEFNAIKLWDSGYKNVVSFGSKLGLTGELLGRFYGKDIILYYDTDANDPDFEARTKAIEELRNNTSGNISYIQLPEGIDINDYLLTHTKAQFDDDILANMVHVPSPNTFLPGEYRTLPDAEKKSIITLEQAQNLNQEFMGNIAQNLQAYSGKNILNNMPVGTAKTTEAIKIINARTNDMAMTLTSTHYLATDYEEAIDPERVIHIKGRGHKDIACPYIDKANYWTSRGYATYFKLAYCLGKCERKDECKHIRLLEAARTAQIVIAVHSYGLLKDFFTSPYFGNNKRNYFIIDEEAQLIQNIYFNLDVLDFNVKLLELASQNLLADSRDRWDWTEDAMTASAASDLASMVKEMRDAFMTGRGYKPTLKPYTKKEAYKIDKAISAQIREHYFGYIQKNMLHDLIYVINNGLEFFMDHRKGAQYYTWRAIFPAKACVIMLTGTTPQEYIEKTLGITVDFVIGEGYYVKRDNLKVVQMLNVTGGRQRLLSDKERQAHIRQAFDLILEKHANQKIMIVTSQGAGIATTEDESTAKDKIMRLLDDIAAIKHNRLLVPVETEHLEEGVLPLVYESSDIPVIHYGIQGTNLFESYEVMIELNAHYYHQQAIIDGVKMNFGVDINGKESTKAQIPFKTLDAEYYIERYTYGVPEVDLYIEATQKADVIQAEGRILRGTTLPKVIYRLHNINIEPYADAIYKSWDGFYEGEFGYKDLKGKLADVWDWIDGNIKHGQTFGTSSVADGTETRAQHITRHLKKLAKLNYVRCLFIDSKGGRNKGATWERIN